MVFVTSSGASLEAWSSVMEASDEICLLLVLVATQSGRKERKEAASDAFFN